MIFINYVTFSFYTECQMLRLKNSSISERRNIQNATLRVQTCLIKIKQSDKRSLEEILLRLFNKASPIYVYSGSYVNCLLPFFRILKERRNSSTETKVSRSTYYRKKSGSNLVKTNVVKDLQNRSVVNHFNEASDKSC